MSNVPQTIASIAKMQSAKGKALPLRTGVDSLMDHELGDLPTEKTQIGCLVAGQLVDHFKILYLLGRGGMGEVYLAKDTKLGRNVALKILHPAIESARVLDRFLFEARTTAQFSHPCIVTIHSVGDYRGSSIWHWST